MDMARTFGLPAALLVVAVAANRLSRWTRVPDIIVLLLIGVGLGPVLKWVDPSHFEATVRILGMLALILILFEGGLELRLKEAIRYSPGGVLLAFVSYGFTGTCRPDHPHIAPYGMGRRCAARSSSGLNKCGGGPTRNPANQRSRTDQNHSDWNRR